MDQRIFASGFLICSLLMGCSGSDTSNGISSQKRNSNPSNSTPPPPPREEELSPISNRVAYPSTWSEIVLIANMAKTTVDAEAHFVTTRNTCGKDAYGAIDLPLWNSLVAETEKALKLTTLTEPVCIDPPTDTYKYLDGTVEVATTADTKKTLYENIGGQICHKISDPQLAKSLLNSFNSLILVADKEDCPNGWGRD